MNKIKATILFIISATAAFCQTTIKDKVIFENSIIPDSYYYSEAGYTENSWIKNVHYKAPVSEQFAFTPGNSLELHYLSSEGGSWNVKVSHTPIRGIDSFKPASHISLWMFLKSGSENALPFISMLAKGETDSDKLTLNDYIKDPKSEKWTRILIPLTDFSSDGLTADNIIGIQFSQGGPSDEEQHLFFDQVELIQPDAPIEINQMPKLLSVKGYEQHFDLTWEKVQDPNIRHVKIYRSLDGGDTFEGVGIQSPRIGGYTDFIGAKAGEARYRITFAGNNYQETAYSNALVATTKQMTDEELLDMVQESHFRYYWDGAEANSGLALEDIPGRTNMIATGASGFGIMAIIAGVNRGFVTREEATNRFVKIIDFLLKADRFHGVFPHFLNGNTGETVAFFGPKDNGGDLVETSFLMQGLLTARQFFDGKNKKEEKIRNSITKLWKEVEWDWYKRYEDSDFLFWHWSPDQEWVINHKLIGWNETLITYFLVIASQTNGVSPSMYYSGWASRSEEAKEYRANWGLTPEGSEYINGNIYHGVTLPVGVSKGGPLFFIHYSFLGLDPHEFTDRYVNYFENNKRIAKINLRYCIENPEDHQGYGEDFWGLTASDGPEHYSANEPKPEKDEGKMTPTGALASFPYTPEASMDALKNYYRNYGHFLYGYYGFRDAFILDEKWCSPIYMGLNQAPVVVMIENYRSGLLWDLFMSAPEVKNGFDKLGISYE
jgi:hypothetical protein